MIKKPGGGVARAPRAPLYQNQSPQSRPASNRELRRDARLPGLPPPRGKYFTQFVERAISPRSTRAAFSYAATQSCCHDSLGLAYYKPLSLSLSRVRVTQKFSFSNTGHQLEINRGPSRSRRTDPTTIPHYIYRRLHGEYFLLFQ